jgi:hypothetical protein
LKDVEGEIMAARARREELKSVLDDVIMAVGSNRSAA